MSKYTVKKSIAGWDVIRPDGQMFDVFKTEEGAVRIARALNKPPSVDDRVQRHARWNRVRVVVEIPVRGDYSEKDLVWDVQRVVSTGSFLRLQRRAAPDISSGRVEVKEMSRVLARLRIDGDVPVSHEAELLRVRDQIDRLLNNMREK